jgi:DNA repair exonuclease SbcCD ATPase subunit
MSEEELKKQEEEQAKLDAEKAEELKAKQEAEKKQAEIEANETEKMKLLRKNLTNSFGEKMSEIEAKAELARKELEDFKSKISVKEKQLEIKEALLSSEIDPEFYDIVSDILMKAENTEEELKKLVETKPKMLKAKEEGNKSPYFTSSSSDSSSSTMTKDKAMQIINSGDNKLYQANLAEITKVLT